MFSQPLRKCAGSYKKSRVHILQRFLKVFTYTYVAPLQTVPNIGHCPTENFPCPVAINILPVVMTDGLNFVFITLFLIVSICLFNTCIFITNSSCKWNIELNKQNFINIYYSFSLVQFVEPCLNLPVQRNFFFGS